MKIRVTRRVKCSSSGTPAALGRVAIIVVYLSSTIALVRFYWNLPERNDLLHLVVPVLGALVLVYPLWSVAQPGEYPYNLVPLMGILWALVGTAVYAYLRTRDPRRLEAAGSVLAEEGLAPAQATRDGV